MRRGAGFAPRVRVAAAAKCLLAATGLLAMTAWTDIGPLVPLVYHGRPLTEVIEDIQPYTRRHIVIDPAVQELQYSGIVKPQDVDAWIRDLPAIYPVSIVDCRSEKSRVELATCIDPTRILIRSRLDLYQNSLRSARR